MTDDLKHADTEERKDGSPKIRLRYSLEELLGGVTPEEVRRYGSEIDWGPDVGREVIKD